MQSCTCGSSFKTWELYLFKWLGEYRLNTAHRNNCWIVWSCRLPAHVLCIPSGRASLPWDTLLESELWPGQGQLCHPKDGSVWLQDLCLLLYCAMQVTVVQCELILNKWHLLLIAILKSGVWVWVGHCQDVLACMASTFTEKFSIIDEDNFQNFVF